MFAISLRITKNINLNLKESGIPVNLPDCYTRIAEIACYKTENRDSETNHKLEKLVEQSDSLGDEYETKHTPFNPKLGNRCA